MIKKTIVSVFAILLMALCLITSCKNDIANPNIPSVEPSEPSNPSDPAEPSDPTEPTEATEKEISEIGALRFIATYLEELNYYDDIDDPSSIVLLDIFDEFDLASIAVATYGKTNGIVGEPYLIGTDGEWYYLDEDTFEIAYENVTDNSDSSFVFTVTQDGDKRTTEAENMRFSIDITVPEVKTLSVDLNAKIISSGKTVSTADFFNKENYEIRISINGKDYPVLYIHSDSKGRTFTYGEYYYNHVHDFSDWEMTYPLPTETTPGKEKHSCTECYFEEEREVAPTNSREISIDSDALEKVYDGKPAVIDIESINFKGKGTVDPVIEFKSKYDDDSAYSINAPVNAGDYYVRVTVPADGEYQAVSTYEVSYSIYKYNIDSNKINPEQLFSSDNRVYNGMKQRWEITLSSTESGEGYYNLPDMPTDEEIRLIAESDSGDAGSYTFYYGDFDNTQSNGTAYVEPIEDTLLSNYSIRLIGTAHIEKAKLEGSLSVEKEFDESASFTFVGYGDLLGVAETDRADINFYLLRSTAYPSDSNTMRDVKIYRDDVEITRNYSFSLDQFELRITPKEVTLMEFGDILYTPYLATNIGVTKNRTIRLEARNGVVRGYTNLTVIDESSAWNINEEISFDDYYLWSSNYVLDELSCPKTLKVVEVDNDMSTLLSEFSIGANGYVACKFSVSEGEEFFINGDGKDTIVPYVCTTGGDHYYLDYPNDSYSISLANVASSGYLFLYSKDGADNLKVTQSKM